MPAYGVSIHDTARPALRKFAAGMNRQGLGRVAGTAGAQAMRDWYTTREADPSVHVTASALGARPVGLYAEFARGTHWEESNGGIDLVTSHDAIRQKIYGGELRPTGGRKYMTVAANSFAYGRRAKEVGIALVFAYAIVPWGDGKQKRPALVAEDAVTKEVGKARKDGSRRKRTIRPAGIYYWLIRKATQIGNRDVVIKPADLIHEIELKVAEYVALVKKEAGRG